MISHYSIIANMVQVAQFLRLTDKTLPPEQLAYRPGSVTLSGVLPVLAIEYEYALPTQYFLKVLPFFRKSQYNQ